MEEQKSRSMYRTLIIRIVIFLVLPFLAVTAFMVLRIVDEGMKSWRDGIELKAEQGRSVRDMHVQNVRSIANRICTDNSLSGFLLADYTNHNLQYYRAQMASVVTSDNAENYGYTVCIFYKNPTIPRGFGSFFFLSDLDEGKASEFIASEETERWVLPCGTDGYTGRFTPYEKHYTYLRKVLINEKLLYVLAVSVPEREMDAFLYEKTDGEGRLEFSETAQYETDFIINYDASRSFRELSADTVEEALQAAERSGCVVEEVSVAGFPQTLIYVHPPNPRHGLLIIIVCVSVAFAAGLVLTVMRFIRKLAGSMYACLEQFDASVAGGFRDKLPLKGNDEITRMARAFNEQIDRIQELLTLTAEQACLVKESQLKSLQQQINPHFLYNTLEAFSYKMELYGHYEEADAMVSFSNMLRYNMAGKEPFSSLHMELKQVENYMCIQQLKFTDIVYDTDIPPKLYDLRVPRFLLQPIIENCFTHGYYGKPLHIVLSVAEKEGFVHFEIADNGRGLTEAELAHINEELSGREDRNRTGIGLSNINARLCLFYSDECRLHVSGQEWKRTVVTWKLPVKEYVSPEERRVPHGRAVCSDRG